VTIGVTVDSPSQQTTVTEEARRYGQCDDGDGRDDEMQSFSNGSAALYGREEKCEVT
jgi:hypothetical protein